MSEKKTVRKDQIDEGLVLDEKFWDQVFRELKYLAWILNQEEPK